jgi:hypothetical protein
MHGKDVTVPKGTEITAYVNGNVDLPSSTGEAARTALFAPIPAPASAPVPAPAPAPAPAPVTVSADTAVLPEIKTPPGDPSTVIIRSNPDGSEILVDGKFMGSTPSTVQLSPGAHTVAVQQGGFKTWQRNVSINSGSIINLNAVLEKNQ